MKLVSLNEISQLGNIVQDPYFKVGCRHKTHRH
jgi:hypothetical protein